MDRRSFIKLGMLASASVWLGAPSTAFAIPQRGAEETAALASAQAAYDQAQAELMSYGTKLEETQRDIHHTELTLAILRGDIATTHDDIARTQDDLDTAQKALAAYLEISYKQGNASILDVLLSSRDFNDYVTRMYYVSAVQDAQVDAIKDIKYLRLQLEQQRELLVTQESQETELLAQLQSQEVELSAAKASSDATVASLSVEVQALFQAQQAELQQAAANRAMAQTASEIGAEIGLTITGQPTGSIVEDAWGCLGVPYVWGGCDENFSTYQGFDCSGFVQHVYALEGYSIGRTTWDQIDQIKAAGKWVDSVDYLTPGDLIFPSDSHVGIYIGEGKMIDAPSPGLYIRVDDVTSCIGGGCPV